MRNDVLQKYIEDPHILYIYEIGIQIYGLLDGVKDRDFLIICDSDYTNNDFLQIDNKTYAYVEDIESEKYGFTMMYIEDWFEQVLNGSILAWECSCLPKKYIYKEHVKLLVQPNPLNLRKTFNRLYPITFKTSEELIKQDMPITGEQGLWSIVKYVMFANQIIENHKIINFKEPKSAYQTIVNGQISDLNEIVSIFKRELNPHLERFKQYTNGILAKSKLDYIKQNA